MLSELSQGKKLFEHVRFDSEGRYLLMHNLGALKYYRINVAFLALFLATSVFTYKRNKEVFINDRFAKFYLGSLMVSLGTLYFFANKHIQAVYLLKGQQHVGIYTYSNFGLSLNRMIKVPVAQLSGTRLFWTKEMNIFQLEYTFPGKVTQLTKQRSFFYRPEHIENQELWNEIKTGKTVLTVDDLGSASDLEVHRKMQKARKNKKHMYR